MEVGTEWRCQVFLIIFVSRKTNIDMLSNFLDIPNNLSVRVKGAECGQKRTPKKSGRNKKQKGDKTV